jgi:chorismate-pyruvate lyase
MIKKTILSKLKKHAAEIPNVLKVLLTTDGSITAALEVLYGAINICALSQKHARLDAKTALKFSFPECSLIKRKTEISASGRVLVSAVSFIALDLMPEKFAKDLLAAKLPIGKIIAKYGLETRREIEDIEYDAKTKRFGRVYKIIFNGSPVMLITEFFSSDIQ